MRDADAVFDAMRLQATALDVNLACRRLRLGLGDLRDRDRVAFADAVGFIDRARRGQQMRVSRRLSATPTSDLLALRYTQEAKARVPQEGAGWERLLDDLSAALTSLARSAAMPEGNLWNVEQIDDFFGRIFWLATGIAAQPTDLTRPRMSHPVVMSEVLSH